MSFNTNLKKTILLVSNEPWGDIWFSKQHYANELSKYGYSVYFINPSLKWNIKNLFYNKIELNQVSNSLHIVSYNNIFPQWIFRKTLTKINDFINQKRILRLINDDDIIWWKFDPFRFLKTIKGKSIYHVVDPYMHLWQDKYQAKNTDLVVCTSPKYLDFYKKLGCKTLFIPHGISEEEYLIDTSEVNSIKKKYGEFAVIIGTINEDYDLNLIKYITNNNVKLIIIGSDQGQSELWQTLKRSANVMYLGVVHAKKLNNYISAAKVCLNPYKFDLQKIIGSRSPLKILNYLSQKKPIISSTDTEIYDLEEVAIYTAKNKESYLKLIQKGMKDTLEVDPVKIANYLEQHHYSKLIETIINKV